MILYVKLIKENECRKFNWMHLKLLFIIKVFVLFYKIAQGDKKSIPERKLKKNEMEAPSTIFFTKMISFINVFFVF